MEKSFSLVENSESQNKIYNSILVDPKHLGFTELPLKIINELAREPQCAMDLSRRLNQHEQKIYYHVRKLENVGLIKTNRTERRYGMIAKLYESVYPVISTKLYDDGQPLVSGNLNMDPDIIKFFRPFIEDGKLNAKIIIGDPNEHGRFDRRSKSGNYIADLSIFFGSFLNELNFPYYKVDTEVKKNDLNNNLIILGSIRTNVVLDKIKDFLPIYYEESGTFHFVSKKTGKSYKDSRVGYIIKQRNPLHKSKWILVIGGSRTRGSRAALTALTNRINGVYSSNDKEILRVVKGLDRTGDGIIDHAEVIE